MPRTPARAALALTGLLAAASLGACSLAQPPAPSGSASPNSAGSGGPSGPGETGDGGAGAQGPGSSAAPEGSGTVTLVTHESFAAPKGALAEFTRRTGHDVKVVQQGDSGSLTNRLVLTKGSPLGDAVFGIDTTFASRAVKEGVLAPYRPQLPPGAQAHALDGDAADRLAPVDYGDVCVNVDHTWFAKKGQTPPRTFDDLVKPEYRGLFVTPGAASSSPGLAFLLATVGAKGEEGFADYWKALVANDTKIVAGWNDAYGVDFTAGAGKGERPVVLSYASSPPFTIPEGESRPTTRALLDTCFRQVEYAGVLEGAKNPQGARALVDFLLSKDFQAGIPDAMYVYPVRSDVELPALWARWATMAPEPVEVSADDIDAHREEWLAAWSEATQR